MAAGLVEHHSDAKQGASLFVGAGSLERLEICHSIRDFISQIEYLLLSWNL